MEATRVRNILSNNKDDDKFDDEGNHEGFGLSEVEKSGGNKTVQPRLVLREFRDNEGINNFDPIHVDEISNMDTAPSLNVSLYLIITRMQSVMMLKKLRTFQYQKHSQVLKSKVYPIV